MQKIFKNIDYNYDKSLDEIIVILKKFNQLELIEHIDKLSEKEKILINKSLNKFNIENYFKNIVNKFFFSKQPAKELNIEPVEIIKHIEQNSPDYDELKSIGENALENQEVAFLVVAGGQGTRLGFNHPKGMFPIAPITKKTLFNIHFEKILAISKYYNFNPTFLIMTSDSNYNETFEYIESNNYFNLKKDNVFIFKQGSLPAIDFKGNLILKTKTELFFAPDGHGGTIAALKQNGLIEILKKRRIKYISYFQVDNPLTNIADPLFIGLHIKRESEVSTKVIKKRDWKEKVGVAGKIDGKPGIIEYSDLPDELAKKVDKSRNLLFGYGNIAIHIFNLSFIEKISSGTLVLPFHIARKKIPYFDKEKNTTIIPENPNGIKFEQFIFDTIPLAKNTLFYETFRELEFAPLKNKTGEDSIETCKKGISNFFLNWFIKSGFTISNHTKTYENDIKNKEKFTLEISPLFAVNYEQFNSRIKDFIKNIPYKLYIE